jgi:tetratricopeptide (TPR) repeat protein
MTKAKNSGRAGAGASKAPAAAPVSKAAPGARPPAPPVRVPPLFRRIDWLAAALAFGIVGVVYYLCLAPELTLEDSGELVTGSLYAGIPHPPGYPVWTIYSWLWTVLVPVGNMAWRVALAEAFAGATACGLMALLVSRGSSMLMEGIEELRDMTGKWESAICMVSGLVSGLLVGFNGFMWRESVAVNRIAVSSVPVFLLMLVFLMRWIYAPHQLRYAYWAAFVFGICYTMHQSLIVAALGFEVMLAAGNPRLGRDVFLGNFVVYLLYWLAYELSGQQHLFRNIGAKPGLLVLFNAVGIGSLAACILLTMRTRKLGTEWLPILIMFGCWVVGISFYLYEPISGMTDPPMQWGYPRTAEGFWHALTRGQYEQPNPTDVLTDPMRFFGQLGMLIEGIANEFTWVYMFIALVPFLFILRMQKRERAWIIGLSAMYFFLGVLMMILMNPTLDRASAELIRVFFTSSHTIVACLIGYGLAVTASFMATHYGRFRLWGWAGGCVAVGLAIYCLWEATGRHYCGFAGQVRFAELPHWIGVAFRKNQDGLPIFANLLLVGIACAFVGALTVYRQRGPLLVTLGLFATMPLYSVLAHWYESDQHNHWFGYWFGHDMFTPPFKMADGKPIYPEMTKDAVLFGGTDPGRFCPTYMIFCESFTPHHCQPLEDQRFDRRDVYIITQNALADGTYLDYIRAHYNRSAEIDPPFFREVARNLLHDREWETNILARAVGPLDRFFTDLGDRVEKRRRTFTSWFVEGDFIDLPAFQAKLAAGRDPLSKYLFDNLSPGTRQRLSSKGNDGALRRDLARDLNRLLERELDLKKQIAAKQQEKAAVDQDILEGSQSERLRRKQEELGKEIAGLSAVGPLYQPERFKQVALSEYLTDFIKENPQSHTRIRLNRLLLEAAYPKELARSLGGVYPDREIYTPSPDDSRRCFQEYMADAQRRIPLNQLKPGEDVKIVGEQVQVSGQVAVMAINGLLTKVIFDHNPKNEFFVEESFPLDWMYPYLTPYGVIMKINRHPLSSLSPDVLNRDHVFWKQFSKRMIGDFIDYGTSVKEVTDWVQKTYVRRDFNGFTGDLKFVRDNDGQKAFSKLRSSIGGVYAWRLHPATPPEYQPKTPAERDAVIREADFTFLQAFAFCPYSPEAVFRYVQLLLQLQRFDDAILVAQTCLVLDPYNGAVVNLLDNLKDIKSKQAHFEHDRKNIVGLEDQVRTNPAGLQVAFDLAVTYLQMQQTDRAVQVLSGIASSPYAQGQAVLTVAKIFAQMLNWPRLETTLERFVTLEPSNPEAWFDLAALKANLGKPADSLPALKKALDLSAQRLKRDPKAFNLLEQTRKDARFSAMRQMPEFQKLVSPKEPEAH